MSFSLHIPASTASMLSEWVSTMVKNKSLCMLKFHPCSTKAKLLFLQQPASVINMRVTVKGFVNPGHKLPLWNIIYSLRLNVAVWIPNAPPLILSCWDITASGRIKTWLMAKVKSSHPVTMRQFKSMRHGLALTVKPFERWGLEWGWWGEGRGRWVPWVYLVSAG